MANQTAIKIHTQPGDQLICDHFSHIFNYEGGGVSFNSGVSCSLIEGDRGRIKAEQVEEKINPVTFITHQEHHWFQLKTLQIRVGEHVTI